MPHYLVLPSRLFLALSGPRDWRIETLSPASVALFDRGGRDIFNAPAQPVALSIPGVIAYAALWGFKGDALIRVVDDVLAFDESFLRQARERAAAQTRDMNR